MSLTKDIKYKYATFNIAEKLVVVNVAVFILNALLVFFFNLDKFAIIKWFELPKVFSEFLYQPWSIVTYSFFHAGFFHLFFNMLLLYFSGRIFLNLFGARRFMTVYFLGAVCGGLVFLLSFNFFPVFNGINTSLIGASAAVMAILIFVCSYLPNQEVRIIFFNIKLWHLGLVVVLLALIQIPKGNAGGRLAHLGGALIGFVYAKRLLEGKDMGRGMEAFTEKFVNLFKRNKKSPLKTVHRNATVPKSPNRPVYSKTEYQQRIDDILDKISKSGYESLSKEEKDFLFKAGKE